MPVPPEEIIKAIEILQDKLQTIEAELKEMKRTVRAGKQVSQTELDMTVRDIDRLKALMDEQMRVGTGH